MVEAVVDTGANFSVISEKLANDLQLLINITKNTTITVANNESTNTVGKVQVLPIIINNISYTGEAVVLKHTAQELLIGTNFLSKYRCTIDLENKDLKIPRQDEIYDIIKLSSSHIDLKNLKRYVKRTKNAVYKCHSISKFIIRPQEIRIVDVEMKGLENEIFKNDDV